MGVRKSNFTEVPSITPGSYCDVWFQGTNYKVPVEVFYQAVSDFINPVQLSIKNVTNPYEITDDDSGTFLIFDDAGTAELRIP